MTVEWYAALVGLVGVYLWLRGTVLDSVIALMFYGLFGGGAAFVLGHTSVTPESFALVLLVAHALLSMFSRTSHINHGIKTNSYFAFYCLYGAATAYVLPQIFLRQIALPPLSFSKKVGIFAAYPLHFSLQNLTTGAYLIGALLASVCAGAAACNPKSRQSLVRWGLIIAWAHIFFGILGLMLTQFGGDEILKFFRNATYAELIQSEAGFVRISGIDPEPSSYAAFAFSWLVLMTEFWLRNVSPRLTGATAVAILVVLVASTSSGGFAALGIYGLALAVRAVIAPDMFRARKVLPLIMFGLAMTTLVLAGFAFLPSLLTTVSRVLASLTVHKFDTLSGRQRLFWAQSAVKAFQKSWGLGVGAGSFRSSSLLLAILGGMGVVGLAAFAAHLLAILKPLRRDTYAAVENPDRAIPVAAAWGACAGLIPGMLAAPSPIPGYTFAILGGLALGWRLAPSGALSERRLRPAPYPDGASEVAA